MEQNTVKYYREYFNPICNEARAPILARGFGDERITHFSQIMTEISSNEFHAILAESWDLDPCDTTKENFSATKLHHFLPRFNVVILRRKILHTFPTSRPDFIAPIATSFMLGGPYRSAPLALELNEVRRFLTHLSFVGPQEVSLAAYAIQHMVLMDAGVRFGIPVIRYEDMMTTSGAALEEALRPLESFAVDVPALARVVEQRRSFTEADLQSLRQRYHQHGYEGKIERLFRFIVDTVPHIGSAFEDCFF